MTRLMLSAIQSEKVQIICRKLGHGGPFKYLPKAGRKATNFIDSIWLSLFWLLVLPVLPTGPIIYPAADLVNRQLY